MGWVETTGKIPLFPLMMLVKSTIAAKIPLLPSLFRLYGHTAENNGTIAFIHLFRGLGCVNSGIYAAIHGGAPFGIFTLK
jgi:hypothetical protein